MTDEMDILGATLRCLKKVEGKTLLWVSRDETAGCVYLVFQGLEVIAVSDATGMTDGSAFCERFLAEKLTDAQDVLKLEQLHTESKNPVAAPVEVMENVMALESDDVPLSD